MKRNWQGKEIIMVGAARQGQALARFMTERGAHVTLTDAQSFDRLQAAREALADLPVHWVTGGHPDSLLDHAEFICVTGGADLRIDFLRKAAAKGLPLLNDTEIFLQEVSAPVIGITGSSGKTTTTTLVGRIAGAYAARLSKQVHVGGNIGNPLLAMIASIQACDAVILELSSFQLELTTISPHIAAILNITPNHLDRHETMENYIAAKRHILDFQTTGDYAILNRDDINSYALRTALAGSLISFGMERPAILEGERAFYIADQTIRFLDKTGEQDVMNISAIHLRGQHNLMNAMAACAISSAAGFTIEDMRAGIEGFSGVPHRLQFVREFHGARWYNDSIATAPERTLAALKSFDEPIIALLGGRDKKLPWDELTALLHEKGFAAVLFGEAAELIAASIERMRPAQSKLIVRKTGMLEEAVSTAANLCRKGDVVLLSPGGTSYDAFVDFEERGKAFTKWVLQLNENC